MIHGAAPGEERVIEDEKPHRREGESKQNAWIRRWNGRKGQAMMSSIMQPMTIKLAQVTQRRGSNMLSGLLAHQRKRRPVVIEAVLEVEVPGLAARARIEMQFSAPTGTDWADWAEIAYERALMMLDPA